MIRRKFLALGLSTPGLCAGLGSVPSRIVLSAETSPAAVREAAASYHRTLASIRNRRAELVQQYQSASGARRPLAKEQSRQYVLATLLQQVFPAWYGTEWAFEGTSETPGQGQIACGYFVTTTLRDAGFQLPRVRLAQQASQVIIRSLCDSPTIKLYYEKPLSTLAEYLDRLGAGLYIVGLDQHTGFVANDGPRKAFIHSSYFTPPRAVCADTLEGYNPLTQSKYRMIGKLLSDAQVMQWLNQETIPIKP